MKTFKDNADRTWTLSINVDAIKRARSLASVDLLAVLDDGCKLLAQLHDDPILLVDTLYAICKPDAERLGVSDVDFGRAMAGDAILHAAEALFADLIDFFPDAQKRKTARDLLSKLTNLSNKVMAHAQAMVEAIDEDSAAAKLINSFGNSPAA